MFFPDKAPNHVRQFMRLAAAGVFDGTSFHRVVRGFVVQTGSLGTRGPLAQKQQKTVRPIGPEFNDTKHVKGILSMARGDDPASALTSFFIVTGDSPSLDGKYTGVRARGKRDERGRGNRADAGERRGACQQNRPESRKDREIG